IRLGKEIALEIGGRRIDVVHERSLLRRGSERRRRAETVRLGDPRHLRNAQPFRKRDVDHENVAARDLVDHLEWRHRAAEAVIARLEVTPLSAEPERGTERGEIADDAGVHQALYDRAAA